MHFRSVERDGHRRQNTHQRTEALSLALEYGTASKSRLSGVTLATSTRLVELRPLGWTLEGAEGLAKLDAQTLLVMGQVNGGVTSRIVNGDPNLKVEDHQVDTNGLITPPRYGQHRRADVRDRARSCPKKRSSDRVVVDQIEDAAAGSRLNHHSSALRFRCAD
jgi:hypothetical protein